VLVILAVQRGSPATVPTLAATTPLMLLVGAFLMRPRARRYTSCSRAARSSLGVALTAR
jgi:drug/metabolite transporter (DMT)-like permease